MGSMTAYLKNKLLDHATGKTEFTKPTAVYLAAFVGDPATTSGVEVAINTTTAYARQAITWAAASAGSASSSADVSFPVAGSNWGTITHLAIYDAATSGNMLWSDDMPTSKTINTGDQLKVASPNCTVAIS